MLYPKIPRSLDLRVKLTDEERQDIRELYSKGSSIRRIARIYTKVCRRTIQFVLFPLRAKLVNENSSMHVHDYPSSSRLKRSAYMRKHRKRKHEIHGELFKKWRKENRKGSKNVV